MIEGRAGVSHTPIPFIDLQAQRKRLADRIDARLSKVLEHGRFIMGPEVQELEEKLAVRCGVRHVVTCSSGTDALLMAMMALDTGPGDAVLVPSFTFAATAEAVAMTGASPALVDIDERTFNMDPESVRRTTTALEKAGIRAKAVVPVDMFGLPADYEAILPIASDLGLDVVADAAQSFGAESNGSLVGKLGRVTITSFFPSKPLGCYGDGGALFTDDGELAELLRSIRVHGQGSDKYDNVRLGLNARLDTIQAAVLIEKLAVFDEELMTRDAVANRYTSGLRDGVTTPIVPSGSRSAWAQYTVRHNRRDALAQALDADGIPTAIYYRQPLHLQAAYSRFPTDPEGLTVSEQVCREVLSLPMHPYLEPEVQDVIINRILAAC